MNDTVYRQAAIEAMCAACKDWCDEGVCQKVSALQRLLSADPVIRCKDCEYYHPSFCEIWSRFGTVQTRENGYCYMAERRG